MDTPTTNRTTRAVSTLCMPGFVPHLGIHRVHSAPHREPHIFALRFARSQYVQHSVNPHTPPNSEPLAKRFTHEQSPFYLGQSFCWSLLTWLSLRFAMLSAPTKSQRYCQPFQIACIICLFTIFKSAIEPK